MPVIDDDLDDVPLRPQPPRPSKPPIPKAATAAPAAPAARPAARRANPLIPTGSLYKFEPAPDDVRQAMGNWLPGLPKEGPSHGPASQK